MDDLTKDVYSPNDKHKHDLIMISTYRNTNMWHKNLVIFHNWQFVHQSIIRCVFRDQVVFEWRCLCKIVSRDVLLPRNNSDSSLLRKWQRHLSLVPCCRSKRTGNCRSGSPITWNSTLIYRFIILNTVNKSPI